MSISQHDNLNTAQRLRKFLGVPERYRRRASAPRRSGRLIVEAMEPRYLLSGEGLVLPPPPPQSALHQPILVPPAQLAAQISAPTIVIDPGKVQTSPVASQINEVIFLDPGVEGGTALIQQALANRPDARAEVVVLEGNSDGVQQITSWLKQHQALQAIHLISHGDDAAIRLGSSTLNSDNLADYSASLEGWRGALGIDADILIYGCDVAADARGTDFVNRLATLTGADVAASTNATGAAKLGGDWVLESRTGLIDAAVLYDNSYAGLLALDQATLQLNNTLRTQLLSVLDKIDAVGTAALNTELINADLPGLGTSVNELIGLDTAADATETITLFGLNAAAQTYFTANGNNSTLSGLASALQTAITAKTTAIATANAGQTWAVSVTPSFDPTKTEVIAGLNITIDLANWTKSAQTFNALAGVTFTENGTLASTAGVHINMDAGLVVTGVTGSTNAATALTSATANDAGSWFRFNHFAVSATVQNSDTTKPFSLEAGITTRLVDSDNSDHLNRVTLTDFAALTGASTAAKAVNAVSPELIARASGYDGSKGLFGTVVTGVLTRYEPKARELAALLKKDQVDAVLLSPI